MKKTFAILLAALLLLFSFGASAETYRFIENSSDFDITLPLPEGTTISGQEGSGELSTVTFSKEGLASVRVNIAPTDEYDKESMNDLTDEDIEVLKTIACLQYEDPIATIEATQQGNKYIHICANSTSDDMDSIFTLYKGYFIGMTQWHDDYAEITEADYAFMQQLLYNLEFIELK